MYLSSGIGSLRLAWPGSGEDSVPGLQLPVPLFRLDTAKSRERKKALSIMGCLQTYDNITLQCPHLLILGVCLQVVNLVAKPTLRP